MTLNKNNNVIIYILIIKIIKTHTDTSVCAALINNIIKLITKITPVGMCYHCAIRVVKKMMD